MASIVPKQQPPRILRNFCMEMLGKALSIYDHSHSRLLRLYRKEKAGVGFVTINITLQTLRSTIYRLDCL